MSIETIGLFTHRGGSDGIASASADFDTDFIRRLALDYEDNGYDRLLIATSASWADSLTVASFLAATTDRLKFMIAHRPGFIAPTMAARMLATIDQLSQGRAAVHIITGANDIEVQSDGDFLDKEERYHRSAEYAQILRAIWEADDPIDHDGAYYRFKRAYSRVRPVQDRIPIYWGGSSGSALQMAASAADVFAFGIEPLEGSRRLIETVKGHAAAMGRDIGLCVSAKIITAETEEEAWRYAKEILAETYDRTERIKGRKGLMMDTYTRQKMLEEAEELQDKRLWLGLGKATGGQGFTAALVGSGEQVAEALMDYYDMGVRSFLFHGYDTANDPKRYGKSFIPALRAGAAAREAKGG